MHRAAVVFPEPDSPTMPSVSPGMMSKLTLSTALSTSTLLRNTPPDLLKKCFDRFRTESNGSDGWPLPLMPAPPSLQARPVPDDHSEVCRGSVRSRATCAVHRR